MKSVVLASLLCGVAGFFARGLVENSVPADETPVPADVWELSAENERLQWIIAQQRDELIDLEFLAGHATLQLHDRAGQRPEYDIERFLSVNPRARQYFPYLLDAVDKYEHIWPVDPLFALAILKQESDFGRHVVSKAGALGHAQFIESTARRYGLRVHEPWDWKRGRSNYRRAAETRRRARESRERFLATVGRSVEVGDPRAMKSQLEQNFPLGASHLASYFRLMADAHAKQNEGELAYREYKAEIDAVLEGARQLERDVRERQRREDQLIEVSQARPPRTAAEREIEVHLTVNDYLAQTDPRLSPIYFTDALVHHLADLFVEFKGDRRLVAARYNASRKSMEAAVAGYGGGVGIPLLDETQDYVNKVFALHAMFTIDSIARPYEVGSFSLFASR